MKKIIFVILFLILSAGIAKSQQSGFGLGVMFGEPSGISFKYWLSERNAVDGGLAWSFIDNGSMHIHADYLYHFKDAFPAPNLDIYLGIGGRIKFSGTGNSSDNRLGVRIPVGLVYEFSDAPFDIFLEIAPILDLTPTTEGSANADLGIRYFFK